MSEDKTAIASPTVPQQIETDQPESRLAKRRQSPSPDPANKRPRLSTDGDLDTPSTLRASPNTSPVVLDARTVPPTDVNRGRGEDNAQEERKRGRRLFGGLLNTLSQSATNAQQKKRLEIEKRQQERARLQKAEDESRRAERLQKLREVRVREQVKFDEQSMRIRHSNMLALAQFLCTRSEPKLYYKPWELLPGDVERIKQQVENTERLIDREIREFNKRHETQLLPEEHSRVEEEREGDAAETEGEHRAESSPLPLVAESDSTNPLPPVQVPGPQSGPNVPSLVERDPLEENGEVLVEGDEDTVIY